MMMQAFVMVEIALWLALFSMLYWFAPTGAEVDLSALFVSDDLPLILGIANTAAYALAVFFLEPFYVAAGFAMYLNRRAELEAWDIEQEFRRAFSR
jgi:hypothetical protein